MISFTAFPLRLENSSSAGKSPAKVKAEPQKASVSKTSVRIDPLPGRKAALGTPNQPRTQQETNSL
jgi:hypothetical protein